VWQDIATALCLMLVIEGILPFLYPRRWREMVAMLAEVDDRTMRIIGFVSMVTGVSVLYLVR